MMKRYAKRLRDFFKDASYDIFPTKKHDNFDMDQMISSFWDNDKHRTLIEHTNYRIQQESELKNKIYVVYFNTRREKVARVKKELQSRLKDSFTCEGPLKAGCAIINNPDVKIAIPYGASRIEEFRTDDHSLEQFFVAYHEVMHCVHSILYPNEEDYKSPHETLIEENIADVGAALLLLQQTRQSKDRVIEFIDKMIQARFNGRSITHMTSLSLHHVKKQALQNCADIYPKSFLDIYNQAVQIVKDTGITGNTYFHIRNTWGSPKNINEFKSMIKNNGKRPSL